MADDPQTPMSPPPVVAPPVSAALVVYALYALAAVVSLISAGLHTAPLWSVVGVIGLVICYVKLGDARGTWVESQLRYLIRTFWWGLLIAVICWTFGWLFAITLIGLPIALLLWIAAPAWIIYRIIRGYLLFKDSKPIPA
jgi:uncharacterized membrane protein